MNNILYIEKMIKFKKTKPIILIFVIVSCFIIGCKKKDKPTELTSIKTTQNDNTQLENNNNNITPEKDIDLSKYFDGKNGTAVFYIPHQNYFIYNKEMASSRFSPFSTFKIVSTLIGLNNNILKNESSKMKYNGTKYWLDLWNKDINLEEAFKVSCVWYYHQMINKIDHGTVKNELVKLKYGNADTSEWYGNGSNKLADLNGFWLNSSLKISPVEQVKVLQKILENKNIYNQKHITILKNIMRVDSSSENNIFGKTGSGGNGNGWFVGFVEKENKFIYFAIFLNDKNTAGADAKKIALKIIDNFDTLSIK